MESVDYRVKPTTCPKCGGVFDAATNLTSEGGLRAGDLTICMYCGAALKFLLSGELKKLSDNDLVNMALDAPAAFRFLLRAQNAMGEMRQAKEQNGRSNGTID